jgi:hypothetical protein
MGMSKKIEGKLHKRRRKMEWNSSQRHAWLCTALSVETTTTTRKDMPSRYWSNWMEMSMLQVGMGMWMILL